MKLVSIAAVFQQVHSAQPNGQPPSDAAEAAAAAATDGRVQHAANGSTHAVPHHGPGPDDATAAAAANGLEPAAADRQQHVGQPEGRPSAASQAPIFHGQQPGRGSPAKSCAALIFPFE